MPAIVGIPSDHLVVIGDSISSGIDSHVPAWPVALQQSTNVPVKNLSRPGAQVAEGQDMAGERISQVQPPSVAREGGAVRSGRTLAAARGRDQAKDPQIT